MGTEERYVAVGTNFPGDDRWFVQDVVTGEVVDTFGQKLGQPPPRDTAYMHARNLNTWLDRRPKPGETIVMSEPGSLDTIMDRIDATEPHPHLPEPWPVSTH